MLAEDLRTKSDDELKKELLGLKKKQMNLRFLQSNGQLENTSQFAIIRKDIARVMTVMQQKKLGLAVMSKAKPATKKAPAKAAEKASAKTKAKAKD